MIHSDWHNHSEDSYDASLSLTTLMEEAKKQGLRRVGVTDHVNYNDPMFLGCLHASAAHVTAAAKAHPFLIPGVELTPIPQAEFDYVIAHGTREGYVPPIQDSPYEITLATDKATLCSLGIRYAIGAAHCRWDIADRGRIDDVDNIVREWHRQQMWLACDTRVTILGHPWWHSKAVWYEDFSVIPTSMHAELAAALKENKKHVECNPHVLCAEKAGERFRHQYAEYLRMLFEFGIPITYGSDSHHDYKDLRPKAEAYLRDAGFCDGDFSELSEADLW